MRNWSKKKRNIRRSNSINLYKKQHKNKEQQKEKNSSMNGVSENDIYEIKNNKKIDSNKSDKKSKIVSFLCPDFANITNVESYKKYNFENTYKDPYDIGYQPNNDTEQAKCSCVIF